MADNKYSTGTVKGKASKYVPGPDANSVDLNAAGTSTAVNNPNDKKP